MVLYPSLQSHPAACWAVKIFSYVFGGTLTDVHYYYLTSSTRHFKVLYTSLQSLLVTSKASTRHFKVYLPLQSLPVSSKSTCHFKVYPPLQSPLHVISNLPVTTTSSISHFKVYPSLQSALPVTSKTTRHLKVYPPLQYLPITSKLSVT